ncbi:ead/Ea22-like family protein [Klebsiella pneumoniae]|uniref:ead/Ea22-like family protein n=1 Tax=Klebsiella pneumoniae TaxID=573 RepID=UPI003BF7180F
MTDITELAQRMKAAAEKATQGDWRAFQYHDGRCGIGGGHHDEIMVCEHISKRRPHDAEFIALANPNNVLALVESLEKAQAKADVYNMLRDDYGLREKGVGLADFVDWQAKRIAELESRLNSADKLQDSAFRSGLQHGFSLGQTDDQKGYEQSMAAYSSHAGIKVEDE